MKTDLTKEQKSWIGAQLSKEERKAIIRVSYGGQKDLQFYIAEEKINNLVKQLMTTPPQSIPAAEFKPRFDTSTTAGKIAVMQEAERVGYVYIKIDTTNNWEYRANPLFDDRLKFYNFPLEPKRTLVPWTKDTVPREAWLRFKVNDVYSSVCEFPVGGVDTTSLRIYDRVYTYKHALDYIEHSLDGGKTWLPCGTWKEEV